MIAHLSGKILHKSPDSVIVDTGGVGYEVHIPLSTFYMLPDIGSTISLNIYTYVREDALILFGFMTKEEVRAFKLLIGVSGVGPKLARNIISGVDLVDDLYKAITSEDKISLAAIPGLGKKTVERLILELKDKVTDIISDSGGGGAAVPSAAEGAGDSGLTSDLLSALVNLGYNEQKARAALKRAREASAAQEESARGVRGGESATFEGLLKETLKILS